MIVLHPKRSGSPGGLLQLQLAFFLLLAGFLPLGSLVVATFGPSLLFPFAAVYGGTVLFVQHRMMNWACPNCHRPFLRRGGTGLALLHRSRCGHCGYQPRVRSPRR
jgi:predicted RNA-binding Zn-ribbon protein involved in translation (DUF1610 family)